MFIKYDTSNKHTCIRINGFTIGHTSFLALPSITNMEVLAGAGTRLLIRDMDTRLWYNISTPKNFSWKNTQFHQYDQFEVTLKQYTRNTKQFGILILTNTKKAI